VVDDASASVLDGRAPDLARLLTATESLIRLLPSEPPKPVSSRPNPQQIMWRICKQMRDHGQVPDEGLLQAKLNEQAAEIELDARPSAAFALTLR
jgi:hypothetical protein